MLMSKKSLLIIMSYFMISSIRKTPIYVCVKNMFFNRKKTSYIINTTQFKSELKPPRELGLRLLSLHLIEHFYFPIIQLQN